MSCSWWWLGRWNSGEKFRVKFTLDYEVPENFNLLHVRSWECTKCGLLYVLLMIVHSQWRLDR